MYNNIGGKIKKLAGFLMGFGVLLAVISGVRIISVGSSYSYGSSGNATFIGLLTIVLGSLAAWAGSFVLYGFGELIERVQSIDSKTQQ